MYLYEMNFLSLSQDRETALILAVRHEEVNLELIRSLLKDGDQNLGDKDKVFIIFNRNVSIMLNTDNQYQQK